MDDFFTVSVVIPTYNRKELLLSAVESVLKQTVLPDEIIIVDNGETRCGDINSSDCKVLVIEAPVAAGVSQARNIGLSMSQSDYVAFLDDDDYWHPDYIKNVRSTMVEKNYPDLLVASLFDSQTKNKIIGKNEDLFTNIHSTIRRNPGVVGSNTIVKKEVMLALGGYDCQMSASEDIDILIRFLKNSKDVVRSKDAIVYYDSTHTEFRLSSFTNLMKGKRKLIRKHEEKIVASSLLYSDYCFRLAVSSLKKKFR